MESRSVRNQIVTMDKGKSLTFSLEAVGYSTLRSYAYSISVETGNIYSTKVNRQERKITITRTA
jgi:hypothetical protein